MENLITLIITLGCISAVVSQTCPTGWVSSQTYCYLFNSADTIQWTEAQNECQTRQAQLLRIESTDELTAIQGMLTSRPSKGGNGYWTSLNDRDASAGTGMGTGTWLWGSDEYPEDGTLNWVSSEANTNMSLKNCGAMVQNAQFSHRMCSQELNYVCRKQQPNQNSAGRFGCGSWERAGHKCYNVYTKPAKTWSDANTFCKSQGSRLMKIESVDEMAWLKYQAKTAVMAYQGYWIGLSDTSRRWRWTDGDLADTELLDWNQEPNDFSGSQDCAALSKDGVYSDNSCTKVHNGFICEMPQKSSSCGNGWKANGNECYYFGFKWTTWREANQKCTDLSGDGSGQLLAINTQAEQTFVLNQLSAVKKAPFYFWTSLNDIRSEGLWVYTNPADNTATALTLIVWNSEPNNFLGKEHCVDTAWGGRLNDADCTGQTGYICEKYAQGYSGADTLTLTFSKMTLTLLCLTVTLMSRKQFT